MIKSILVDKISQVLEENLKFLGISRQWRHQITTGQNYPSPKLLRLIAQASEYSYEELLFYLRQDKLRENKAKYGPCRDICAIERLCVKIPRLPWLPHPTRSNLQSGKYVPSPELYRRIMAETNIGYDDWLPWILWKKDQKLKKKYLTYFCG
jgi:transcriptional regulator with XRE-family HTH domain